MNIIYNFHYFPSSPSHTSCVLGRIYSHCYWRPTVDRPFTGQVATKPHRSRCWACLSDPQPLVGPHGPKIQVHSCRLWSPVLASLLHTQVPGLPGIPRLQVHSHGPRHQANPHVPKYQVFLPADPDIKPAHSWIPPDSPPGISGWADW